MNSTNIFFCFSDQNIWRHALCWARGWRQGRLSGWFGRSPDAEGWEVEPVEPHRGRVGRVLLRKTRPARNLSQSHENRRLDLLRCQTIHVVIDLFQKTKLNNFCECLFLFEIWNFVGLHCNTIWSQNAPKFCYSFFQLT